MNPPPPKVKASLPPMKELLEPYSVQHSRWKLCLTRRTSSLRIRLGGGPLAPLLLPLHLELLKSNKYRLDSPPFIPSTRKIFFLKGGSPAVLGGTPADLPKSQPRGMIPPGLLEHPTQRMSRESPPSLPHALIILERMHGSRDVSSNCPPRVSERSSGTGHTR